MDHVYVLKSLIDIYKHLNKTLYCAFIDFSKAFDSVWRNGLWFKLIQANISNKCFKLIHNMYQQIKSCVKLNNFTSPLFSCNIGVRQGENLSPFLFALYINDLESFLHENNVHGLSVVNSIVEKELGLYIKLLVLLYADDTLLLAENQQALEHSLDIFQSVVTFGNLRLLSVKPK